MRDGWGRELCGMALVCYISPKKAADSTPNEGKTHVAALSALKIQDRIFYYSGVTNFTMWSILKSTGPIEIFYFLFFKASASTDFESDTLSYCAVYSSSRFVLLVWARTTTQSNPCQHSLPELLTHHDNE